MAMRIWIFILAGLLPFSTFAGEQWSKEAESASNLLSKDREQGLLQFSRLIEAGDTTAALLLGVMYHNGGGNLPQDKDKGITYLTMAADAGNSDAQTELALRLALKGGRGVPKDHAQDPVAQIEQDPGQDTGKKKKKKKAADPGNDKQAGCTWWYIAKQNGNIAGAGEGLSNLALINIYCKESGPSYDLEKAKATAALWKPKPMQQSVSSANNCDVSAVLAMKSRGVADGEIISKCSSPSERERKTETGKKRDSVYD